MSPMEALDYLEARLRMSQAASHPKQDEALAALRAVIASEESLRALLDASR